ncbi:hypothetical protein [Pedobacter suwonensis]|uniref:hypothetical protein n=1 Tax=Pedobacter suwonensis TaxID=332999 RepID=UPI0011A86868|nr:hypothetical protein [Pedobacter suwonensis]
MNYRFSTILILILFLSFKNAEAASYYWVGGSGDWSQISHWRTSSGGALIPSVIPGPTDNVFFDSNSGFTATNRSITLNITGNCHNITFSGGGVAPAFTQIGQQTLNIYGSSEWQAGMRAIDITNIYYRHSNEDKTIKSNGVITGNINNSASFVQFEEEKSISLLDVFSVVGLNHTAGAWNTNGYTVNIRQSFTSNSGTKPRIINLGSSQLYLNNSTSSFITNSSLVTLNAGTSHIHFTIFSNSSSTGLLGFAGQTYYDVTFEGVLGKISATTGLLKLNKVEFKNDGLINGDNEYKTLIFAPTKTYTLQSGKKQTITTLFDSNTPQCGGWTTIASSTPGTQSNIVAASGVTISVSGAIIKDTNVSGGANFTAANSVDNGNNTGWNFPPYVGKDLYWVGGSGNWNDKSHWSQNSGGIGGYCVPGPADNTFFNAASGFTSSGKTVSVDNISYTHNITFSGSGLAPSFTQIGQQTLNIYGSSEWQAGMPAIDITNIYYRHSNEDKTIKSNGVTTGNINNSASFVQFEEEKSISLLDDFSVAGLNHTAGTWNTNGYTVNIRQSFTSNSGTKPRVINLGSSQLYLNNSTSNFITNSSLVTLNAGTSHIHFTIFSNSSSTGLLGFAGQTYYDVTFEGVLGKISATTGLLKLNKVEFKNDGLVNGDNEYKKLIFAPTKTYTLQSGKKQTITTLFDSNTPQCGGWTTISSSTPGTQSNIVAASGVTISVSGAIIKDTNVSGGANFTAANSVDNGNNTGWNFPPYVGKDLYWVGGSGNWNDKSHWSQNSGGIGGYCVPGPADNTFFNAASGFTSSGKTVSVDNISYTHNITFSGSGLAPSFTQIGQQTLNIYGSSEWQAGMPAIDITNIYYRHSNEDKTIKSNGVITGNVNNSVSFVQFEEEKSISLLDDFSVAGLNHTAGTWNTNGYTVNIRQSFTSNNGTKPRVINLGSSQLYLTGGSSNFITNSSLVNLNSGTSHIHFTAFSNNNSTGLLGFAGQTYYDVTFEGVLGRISATTGLLKLNKVEFKNTGVVSGDNEYKTLIFAPTRTYTLQSGKTQTVESLFLGGTPCGVTFVESSIAGDRANVNVTGTTTDFNFANLKSINASGKSLHFGEQSTIANQNNNNINYAPYNPGAFAGLGNDWLCNSINLSNPSTYIISSAAFYGNANTTYKWYKTAGNGADASKVIATTANLDISTTGYGTYKIEVTYSDGTTVTCFRDDEININKNTDAPTANAIVCKKAINTLADVVVTNIAGSTVKWYASINSTTEIPTSTVIMNGQTYYVSQSFNNCESDKTSVTLSVKPCFAGDGTYINSNLRFRVGK